ncbi:TniQ family protein [Streptomyces flavidovirens]
MTAPFTQVIHVPPMAGELTGSWFRRMALGYKLPPQDLVRAITGARITGTPRTGIELFLNSPARAAAAAFSGLEYGRLATLLPSFASTHERLTDETVPLAAWYAPQQAWVAACPPCKGRAFSPGQPVLLYPGHSGHICVRHQRWLLPSSVQAASIKLESFPEVTAAHRHHSGLGRVSAQAHLAVIFAAAVVWSWQIQGWRNEEIWNQRTSRLARATGCDRSTVAAHALVTYPETIAVARLLANERWQHRLREQATNAGIPAATGMLLAELARRTNRPWLADWLTACGRLSRRAGKHAAEADLLTRWVTALTTDCRTGPSPPADLWTVPHSAVRPLHYSDRSSFLIDTSPRAATELARNASLAEGWEPAQPLPALHKAPCR